MVWNTRKAWLAATLSRSLVQAKEHFLRQIMGMLDSEWCYQNMMVKGKGYIGELIKAPWHDWMKSTIILST